MRPDDGGADRCRLGIEPARTHERWTGRVRLLETSSRRRVIDLADPACDSGLETIARLLPYGRRIPYRTQAVIAGVGKVDLLIGDRLVVELDGAGFHTDATDFAEDRRRGLELVMRGYLVVRLAYRMVIHDWDRVQADLLELVSRGEHRWGARARRLGAMIARVALVSRADAGEFGSWCPNRGA